MKRYIFLPIMAALLVRPAFCADTLHEEPEKLGSILVTPSRYPADSNRAARSVTVLDEDLLGYSGYDAVQDAIGSVGGIDIRRRGPEGVQSDINIRGSTFEQNTVLIDGVKVNDPQTGHFDMDLPLTGLDIDNIEILKGPASSVYGPNSFGGVINILTKKPDTDKVSLESTGGSFDYFRNALSVSSVTGFVKNIFSIEDSHSSGYMSQTEFDNLTLSEHSFFDTPVGEYSFLFGYLKKDFGADSFYSNLYSNEEEHTDTRFFKIDGDIKSGPLTFSPKLFLRRHWDKFILDSNRPGWQTNYHTTYNYGGELNFTLENRWMDAVYGFELSRDTIGSTSLGSHSRTKDGIYLELIPRILEALYLNIGMRADRFSDFGWEFSPSISASLLLHKNLTIRSSIGRAYRVPTFTDLYYNDSANIGDPDLRPESSWSYEAGADIRVRLIKASATFFHRDSSDTIDWIRATSKDRWKVSNIGSTSTNGAELSLSIMPREAAKELPVKTVFLSYTVLDIYDKHDYLSKYALDYLKQQISSGLEYDILGFENRWMLNYKKRIGDSGYITVDIKVSKPIIRKDKLVFSAFLEIANLFDVSYSEQSNVPMPGRWIKGGARLEF